MPDGEPRHLYLPARDRSFWAADPAQDVPLRYLAWGYRNFSREPIPSSRHDGWVTVLIQEGVPVMVVRRREVPMPAGTLAVVGPDCPFGWKRSTVGPSKFLLWMWRAAPAGTAATTLRAAWMTRTLTRSERRPFTLLHDLCRREVLRAAGPEVAYLEGCRILFETTVQRGVLHPSGTGAGRSDTSAATPPEVVVLAQAWLRAHLDSREPIARLCDYLNVSQSTLYRLFVAAYGVSPLAWFHAAKMQRARELIAGEGKPVKEVAYTLGYDHANDLSRAYRRHFGMSPSARQDATTRL